ncbi:MAG TPA: hypothetical protein PKD12_08250 [Nitrospira sp.]|nr:hypothetical protein [Nitrospira sp.]
MSLQTRLSDLITAIGTDYKGLRTWITGSGSGDLTGLATTDKTNLIAAINEVNSAATSGSTPDASTTVKGKIEIATLAEVSTGTDTVRAVTPEGVRQEINAIPVASTTVQGKVELATLAEVATGTDTARAVTPEGVRQERVALKAEILGVGVPSALDTLDELAAALADDAAFSSTVTTALGNRVRVDTAAQGLNSTQQGNARTNIAAQDSASIGNADADLVALYTTAKA